MKKRRGNVVMFPKWKTRLENEGLKAIKEKRYEEALESFEPLFEHNVASHDVVTGKLISLMELGKYESAEELCEYLMKHDHDNYYQYLHIYLTILFQTSRYEELVSLLDEVFQESDMPQQMRTQFWQLYEVSRKLIEDQSEQQGNHYVDEFFEGIGNNDIHKQWRSIIKLRKQNAKPYLEQFIELLNSDQVHPIIKTAIIQWFQEHNLDRNIEVTKFGFKHIVNPSKLKDVHSEYVMQQIQLRLGDMEQENPTMFEIVQKLLYRYLFVRYPILPTDEEVPNIVEALKQLGHEYLQLPVTFSEKHEPITKYKEEIQICEQHYSLIMDD
ncbi:tetratricopeptide repeat protein [Thalassobacillus pellis]|uniref:tetratricopeptide repeat protein n=1 Tax=Thalassobacillus pellis TaxID=748008 RepID=UPI0019609EDA|nr:tetratricopeptide repeat protein [Thalassobacillus pellis]MBM7554592.1 tetratricopeptide (TPR) repeat protein [Thalassobacillus pellis]